MAWALKVFKSTGIHFGISQGPWSYLKIESPWIATVRSCGVLDYDWCHLSIHGFNITISISKSNITGTFSSPNVNCCISEVHSINISLKWKMKWEGDQGCWQSKEEIPNCWAGWTEEEISRSWNWCRSTVCHKWLCLPDGTFHQVSLVSKLNRL